MFLLPIKFIICLTEVKEDFMEDFLPHSCKLPKNLGFKGGSPRSPTHPESMKEIVKLSYRPDPKNDCHQQRLPQNIRNPNTSELPVPLRDEDQHLPRALNW